MPNGVSVSDQDALLRSLAEVQAELAGARRELAVATRKLRFLRRRDGLLYSAIGLVVTGPSLANSMRAWLRKTSSSNPFPRDEFADVLSSVIARFIRVGVLGFILANALLFWQNLLIRSQNQYFREQTAALREQIDLQRDQGSQELRILGEQLGATRQEGLERQQQSYLEQEQLAKQEVQVYFEFRQALMTLRRPYRTAYTLVRKGLIPRSQLEELRQSLSDPYEKLASLAPSEAREAALALKFDPGSEKLLTAFDAAVARAVGILEWYNLPQAEVEVELVKTRRAAHLHPGKHQHITPASTGRPASPSAR